MFNRDGKKPTPAQTKAFKDLTALESATQLLALDKRTELVQRIQESLALEEMRFASLCLPLLHNVAAYCQKLPDTANYYAGDLLDFILNRTEAALQLFRYFLSQGPDEAVSDQQKLWLYALFSAGLLQGIGKLYLDYKVELFDRNGHYLQSWQPLLDTPIDIGTHYTYQFVTNSEEVARPRLNLLLARHLMPPSGFNWLLSTPEVFLIWLALIDEDEDGAGTLGAILDRAKALAIQRQLFTQRVRTGGTIGSGEGGPRSTRYGKFIDNTSSTLLVSDKERILGIEFLRWFRDALASGTLILNQSLIKAMAGGLFVSLKVFEQFIQTHSAHKNWQSIYQALANLGLAKIGADGKLLTRYTTHDEALQGLVIDAAVLPNQIKSYNTKTQQTQNVSALEVMNQLKKNNEGNLQYLNEKGAWQASPDRGLTVQAGKNRG